MNNIKLVWLTDIHLNFLKKAERNNFYSDINSTNFDAVLITGDIAEAPCLAKLLIEMAVQLKKPIYFVLGNHDYYRGQISQVRETMTTLTQENDYLYWLPAAGLQMLGKNIILLGQDGWADGRWGDYQNSRVVLNDSRMIPDLLQQQILGKFQLLEKMQQLADADAVSLQQDLAEAVARRPKNIIVLTHVPPFKEVCMHKGKKSDDGWLPFYSSKIMGDVLMKVAEDNPAIEFLVLCGHTHSAARYQPLDNLVIRAGAAEYYRPKVQEILGF